MLTLGTSWIILWSSWHLVKKNLRPAVLISGLARSTGRSTGHLHPFTDRSTQRQSTNSQSCSWLFDSLCLGRHMKGMNVALGNVCNQFEEKLGIVQTFPELRHHIGPESAGTGRLTALPLLVRKSCMDWAEVLRCFCQNLFPCRTDRKSFQFDHTILDERPMLLFACGSEGLHVLLNGSSPCPLWLESVLCVPHCFCGNGLLLGLGQSNWYSKKIWIDPWNKALLPRKTNMKGFP